MTELSRKTFLDPNHTMIQLSESSYPENIQVDLTEGQFDKEIETYSLHQEEDIEQKYTRLKEKKTLQRQSRIKTAN